MRTVRLAVDECYHLFNRGNRKERIFHVKSDYVRMLSIILLMQFDSPVKNLRRITEDIESSFDSILPKPEGDRLVKLHAFILMPNHFHLLLKQVEESGIARYTQRILNGFTKYINIKNETSGHVFQGPYKAVHIETNEQLLHTSSYIHRNCRELSGWKNRELNYPWSSFTDYVIENRWRDYLSTDFILEQFKSGADYLKFVNSSTAKLSDYECATLGVEHGGLI